jgi:hypothetical protein
MSASSPCCSLVPSSGSSSCRSTPSCCTTGCCWCAEAASCSSPYCSSPAFLFPAGISVSDVAAGARGGQAGTVVPCMPGLDSNMRCLPAPAGAVGRLAAFSVHPTSLHADLACLTDVGSMHALGGVGLGWDVGARLAELGHTAAGRGEVTRVLEPLPLASARHAPSLLPVVRVLECNAAVLLDSHNAPAHAPGPRLDRCLPLTGPSPSCCWCGLRSRPTPVLAHSRLAACIPLTFDQNHDVYGMLGPHALIPLLTGSDINAHTAPHALRPTAGWLVGCIDSYARLEPDHGMARLVLPAQLDQDHGSTLDILAGLHPHAQPLGRTCTR